MSTTGEYLDLSDKDTSSRCVNDKAHIRFIIADPVALPLFEGDSTVKIISQDEQITGIERYLVEQWACSRVHPTFILCTYTGATDCAIEACVVELSGDQDSWAPRLRTYLNALQQYDTYPKQLPSGTLMVTNLLGLPRNLTLVRIPQGDIKKHFEHFVVNENLKRLGCSGRAMLNLSKPSNATVSKFYQLYRTNVHIPFNFSVVELVKLCQMALMLFGMFDSENVDGLLCDVTETAINDWWIEIGNEYFAVELDNLIEPSTIAALLGLLMGAQIRLEVYGAPVSSDDVFDVEATKRGIAYFQKSQQLPKSRRLDRRTLHKLHVATARVGNERISEGWIVSRAVKSTVADLSGKSSEFGTERKSGWISDVETAEFDTFIENLRGERARVLWYGKLGRDTSGLLMKDLVVDMLGRKGDNKFNDGGGSGGSRYRKGSGHEGVSGDKKKTLYDWSGRNSIRELFDNNGQKDRERDKKNRMNPFQRAGVKVRNVVRRKSQSQSPRPRFATTGRFSSQMIGKPLASSATEGLTVYAESSGSVFGNETEGRISVVGSGDGNFGMLARRNGGHEGRIGNELSVSKGEMAGKSSVYSSGISEKYTNESSHTVSQGTMLNIRMIHEATSEITSERALSAGEISEAQVTSTLEYVEGGDKEAKVVTCVNPIWGEWDENLGRLSRDKIEAIEAAWLKRKRRGKVGRSYMYKYFRVCASEPELTECSSEGNGRKGKILESFRTSEGRLRDGMLPRRLSFSVIEQVILQGSEKKGQGRREEGKLKGEKDCKAKDEYGDEDEVGGVYGGNMLRVCRDLSRIEDSFEPWATWQVERLRCMIKEGGSEELASTVEDAKFRRPVTEYGRVRDATQDVIRGSVRRELSQAAQRVDLLGSKMEYLIKRLRGKVRDIEERVNEFESAVGLLEVRIREAEKGALKQVGWMGWIGNLIWGVPSTQAG